jgi:hypothetical protein
MDQKRYAFIMGANGPQTESLSSLKYAERDAERLAAALKAPPCAFTNVEWMTADGRETTLMKLQDFADQCKPSDMLIVHFSGHGIYNRQLYLICNGTKIRHLNASAIDVGSLKSILAACRREASVPSSVVVYW